MRDLCFGEAAAATAVENPGRYSGSQLLNAMVGAVEDFLVVTL